MDTQSIRESILTAPRKQEDVATPFWPGTDGTIAISDVPTDELMVFNSLAKTDPAAHSAALVCNSLINKENGERIFNNADRDTVKAMGGSVLFTIMKQVNVFFGFSTPNAVDEAKKN